MSHANTTKIIEFSPAGVIIPIITRISWRLGIYKEPKESQLAKTKSKRKVKEIGEGTPGPSNTGLSRLSQPRSRGADDSRNSRSSDGDTTEETLHEFVEVSY